MSKWEVDCVNHHGKINNTLDVTGESEHMCLLKLFLEGAEGGIPSKAQLITCKF